MVVAVYVIVSFIKEPIKALAQKVSGSGNSDWIVRPFSVLIALSILLWLTFVQSVVTAETIGLAIVNAFLVALIAGAAHDYIVAPTKEKAAAKQIAAEQAQLDVMDVGQKTNDNSNIETVTAIRADDRTEDPPSTT